MQVVYCHGNMFVTVKGEVICGFVESYCCESGDVVYKKPDPGLSVHMYQ